MIHHKKKKVYRTKLNSISNIFELFNKQYKKKKEMRSQRSCRQRIITGAASSWNLTEERLRMTTRFFPSVVSTHLSF